MEYITLWNKSNNKIISLAYDGASLDVIVQESICL